MNLPWEPLQEGEEIAGFFRPETIIVYSQKDTIGIILRIQTEEEFAELERRPVAALAPKDVYILQQTLSENFIQRFHTGGMEIKSCLWCKLLSKCLPIANGVNGWHELELVAEGALEGEQASFK